MNEFREENDYTIYSISSRYGCFINNKKVRRDKMMNHMNKNTGKYIVFHLTILCEGINLPKLEGLVLLKKLNTIQFIQSVGRVLRLNGGKTEGKVVLPMYSSYLKRMEKGVVNLMERVYTGGETPVSVIRR